MFRLKEPTLLQYYVVLAVIAIICLISLST
jgi:hypothetical protein